MPEPATLDGCTVTKFEQDGEYAGRDMGRLWIQTPNRIGWTWYGGFATMARRDFCYRKAQTMTAQDFDVWFDGE
jgi:hypothetical protein